MVDSTKVDSVARDTVAASGSHHGLVVTVLVVVVLVLIGLAAFRYFKRDQNASRSV